MLGKGMKLASADTDMRTEFGPAGLQFVSLALELWAFEHWYLTQCVLGERRIHHSKKSVLRTTAYVNVKMRGRDKTPS